MSNPSHPARSERIALCDLFLVVGPDAPTLSGAWTTRDLAAHLIVRETRPDAAAGIVVKAVAEHGERVRQSIATQPWEHLVDKVRKGPPMWSPMRLALVDRLVNTVEFFVHHEDVRRGGGTLDPRELQDDLASTLWGALSRMGRMLVRSAPGGVTFVDPDRGSVTAKAGSPGVTVTGAVGELVLFAYGRQTSSTAIVEGPSALVEGTRAASFGI